MRIDRIAAGGDGVGRLPDGRVVFVPRTAPGDLARIDVVRRQRRFARGRLSALIEAGPGRVAPRCAHYAADACGGCQLQHLEPAEQRRARSSIVGDALRRIGGIDTADPDLVTSGPDWGYRTRLSLARGRDGFGFHRWDQPDRVFPLRRCEVAAEPLNVLWAGVREARDRLPPDASRLTLRVDRAGGTHLVVETGDQRAWTGGPALRQAMGPATAATVWWHPADGAARAVAGSEEPYPATSFEQVNPAMGDTIRRFAVDALGPVAGRAAWDLYAGVGETTGLLADAGALVQSVESDGHATAAAERRLAGRGRQVRVRTGRVEDLVSRLPAPDAVVTNPPRAGMDGGVVEALRGSGARRVAYVSCDPATLARDLRPLVVDGPYRLAGLRAFDLFPQTAHVESVAVLELR